MKNDHILFVFSFFLILILTITGCSPSTTTTKIYLQDIEVSGPISQLPVHITDSTVSGITISPRVSFNTKKTFRGKIDSHTLVNSEGLFQIDTVKNIDDTYYFIETPGANNYPFTGKNLTWNIAEFNAALDFDFKVSRSVGFFMGTNYSVIDQKSLWGGIFGLGLMGSGKNACFRVDLGFTIQQIPYEAYTIVSVTQTSSTGTSSYVYDYTDIGTETHFNPFLNLTLNSANPEWLFNIFIQAGYSTQTLADFTPETQVYHDPFYYENVNITEDLRGEAMVGLINITPGIFFNFGESGRVLVGTRLNWTTQTEEVDNSFYLLPMLQFDFKL